MSAPITLYTPPIRLAADGTLSLFGIGFGLFALSAGPTSLIWLGVVLLVLAAGLWFAWRTVTLARTKIALTETGLIWNGTAIAADDLSEINLRFFGGPRAVKSGGGEYQLTVVSGGRKFHTDSRLEGFEKLVGWLAEVSRQRQLVWSPRTRSAFAQFGESPATGSPSDHGSD